MSAIPPTLPPVATPVPTPPAAVVATPVAAVPAAIASLPPNSVVDATVAAQTAQAASALASAQAAVQASAQAAATQARAVVQLMTALGTLSVKLPIAVPPNAQLQLQVLGSGANLQFKVISVNGQPVASGPAVSAVDVRAGLPLPEVATGGATTAETATAPAPGQPAAGSAALAYDVPPATPGGGLAATIVFGTEPGLPNGTQLTVRLLDVEPPGGADVPAGTPGPPGGGIPSPIPGAGGSLALDRGPVPPLAPGAEPAPGEPGTVALESAVPAASATAPSNAVVTSSTITAPAAQPLANAAPAASLAASEPAGLPATLPAVVAPNSLGGLTLLQTPVGLVSLDAGPVLAAGAHVLLETVGAPQLPATPSIAEAAMQADRVGAPSGWSNFGEAMAVLQKADPEAAQMLVARLPDFGPRFVPNMVTWIAAATTGDMRGWLGERVAKALEKADRADLIDKLAGDMGEMRAPATLPQAGGAWQVLTLPLFFGQQIERIRITTRRTKGDEDSETGDEEGTRFLVDVDMSRLGALQFDGLIKRRAKRFDLIVRSRRDLPDDVQREIGGIFARSLEGMGMTGGAIFKTAAAFVEPIPEQPRTGLTI